MSIPTTEARTWAPGDRVIIGSGKAIWIINEITDGSTLLPAGLAHVTREGSEGFVNNTVDTNRLKPAPALTS